jgi:RNA polymerase sigma-70 factor (ECF subfamily)
MVRPLPSARGTDAGALQLVRAGGEPVRSDAALVRALCQGDAAAERAVWNRYAGMVCHVAQRTLGSREDAEDLAQEVFGCLFAKIRSLENPEALRSFIYSITVRTLKWELRRRRVRRWVTLSDTGEVPDLSVPAVDHVSRQLLRLFYAVLDKLAAEERMIFVLRHVERLTLEEVALSMGISLATAKRRLARSNQKVEALLDRDADLAGALHALGGSHAG